MSRPRVVYILGSLAANDVGDELVTILGHLSRSTFEPVVVNLGGSEELKRRLEAMAVRTHSLGLVGPVGAYRSVSRANRLIRELGADVVHGYGSWGGSVAQLAAPQHVAAVRTVTRAPNHEKDLKGRVLRYLERRARRKVDTRFVVPNQGSIGLATRAYGAAEGHVSVLPTSVDVDEIRDRVRRTTREEALRALGVEPGHPTVVLASEFGSAARMDQVLAGFAMAVDRLPTLRVFVVGDGRYEGSTRWKAEELQLSDSVVFLGRGSEDGPVWAAADIAIDATARAGWSRAGLLAMAAGLPTVKLQSGVGGWSEELEENLPMVSGHPERFADELVRLASDEDLRAEIVRDGANVAEEVDVANVAKRLADLYGSLLAN